MDEKYKKMSLREVMEITRNMPISEGGLAIFLEKMVEIIENLERETNRSDF